LVQPAESRGLLLRLLLAATALFAVLLLYSQTLAFAWDEGFHLLAAQLIRAGQKPYIDFCFPQTPLNAWLNAAWMSLFGESWRAIHVLATFWVAAAAFLTAEYVLTRFPVPRWRLAGALAALVAVGTESQVVLFGTIGQAYGICLFLSVAAFRCAVLAVERRTVLWAAAAGICAGAAACSSLLSAAVAPVLLLWILLRSRGGARWLKSAAYMLGGAIPFLPVVWLYLQAPAAVLFNLAGYQFLYRSSHWEGATGQDISALTGWINSAQCLALGLLAVAGLWFIGRKSDWDGARRAECNLAACLALAIGIELATAHPTFERYFLLVVPFVAIPAINGLYAIATRLGNPERPFSPTLLFVALLVLGLGKAVYEDRDSYSWKDCEKIARQVESVTPRNGTLWADELFYFLTRRPPPDGMEFSYAHDVDMPLIQAAQFHILPIAEVHRRARAGAYATIAACYESDHIDKLIPGSFYRQSADIKDCTVFWDFEQ
jgi:hypothetical protein